MNSIKRYREQILMTKGELARKARLSIGTIDRIEKGENCRLDTKRKILLALGLDLSRKNKIFGPRAPSGKKKDEKSVRTKTRHRRKHSTP